MSLFCSLLVHSYGVYAMYDHHIYILKTQRRYGSFTQEDKNGSKSKASNNTLYIFNGVFVVRLKWRVNVDASVLAITVTAVLIIVTKTLWDTVNLFKCQSTNCQSAYEPYKPDFFGQSAHVWHSDALSGKHQGTDSNTGAYEPGSYSLQPPHTARQPLGVFSVTEKKERLSLWL